MIDMSTLRAMAKLMESESDEPGDIRGLRARAVNGMLNEIERLRALLNESLGYIEFVDERGNPWERALEFKRRAEAAIQSSTPGREG